MGWEDPKCMYHMDLDLFSFHVGDGICMIRTYRRYILLPVYQNVQLEIDDKGNAISKGVPASEVT